MHILQLTPKRSATGVLKRTKWKKHGEQTTGAAVPEVMCADSLQETVRNMISQKEGISGDFHLTLGNKQLYEGSFLLKSRYVVPAKKKESPWRVSYVAPQSFNENRWNGPNVTLQLQSRGFKTHRSIDAEMKRNPSMTTRLRDVLSK